MWILGVCGWRISKLDLFPAVSPSRQPAGRYAAAIQENIVNLRNVCKNSDNAKRPPLFYNIYLYKMVKYKKLVNGPVDYKDSLARHYIAGEEGEYWIDDR